jgi:uncharacterized OsmC-like protein
VGDLALGLLSCAHNDVVTNPSRTNKTNFFTGYDLFIQRKFKVKIYIMTSTVVYEGNLRTVCTHLKSSSAIETDAPTDNQGKGERFSPTDLLATSLGACMLTTMGIKARDMQVDLKGTEIEVEKIMKADPRRVGGINLTFHFPDTFRCDEKQRIILERSANTCPVMVSLNPEIEVKVEYNWPVTV